MGYLLLLLIAMAYTRGNKKNEDDFIEIAFGYITSLITLHYITRIG